MMEITSVPNLTPVGLNFFQRRESTGFFTESCCASKLVVLMTRRKNMLMNDLNVGNSRKFNTCIYCRPDI